MLLGKITSTEESGFVQIVTQYGKINTLISPSRLYPCSATTVQLNYLTEISFTAACKEQVGFHRNNTPNNFNVYSSQKQQIMIIYKKTTI